VRGIRREALEIGKIWWLIVPGGVLGAVAIVTAVEDVHNKNIWFWAALAVTALGLATCVRLRRVIGERDAARAMLAGEGTRDAIAHRLDRFAQEYVLLGEEAPPGKDKGEDAGMGLPTNEQNFWGSSAEHLTEEISSLLRQNAPGFVSYWRSNPEPLPPSSPFAFRIYATAFVEMSVMQLRNIAARLRDGHDDP
jgi:hypothetical protein